MRAARVIPEFPRPPAAWALCAVLALAAASGLTVATYDVRGAVTVIALLSLPVVVVVLLQRPLYAFYLFVLVYPFSNFSFGSTSLVSLTPGNVLLLIAIAGVAFEHLMAHRPLPALSPALALALGLLALFALSLILALATAPDLSAGLRFLVTRAGAVATFIGALINLRTVRQVRVALLLAVVSAALTGFLSVLVALGWVQLPRSLVFISEFQRLGQFQTSLVRPLLFGFGYATFGTWVLYTLPLVLTGAWRRQADRRLRWLCRIAAPISLSALFVGFNRGTWVGVGALAVLLLIERTAHGARSIVLLALALALIVGWQVGWLGALTAAVTAARPWNVALRLQEYRYALDAWASSPLVGLGPRGFDLRYAPLLPAASGLDNNFLAVLTDSGLLGFAPYLAFLLLGLGQLAHTARSAGCAQSRYLARMLAVGIVAGIISQQFYVATAEKGLWLMLGIGYALARVGSSEAALG